ncbi:MAG: hypothetical protein ACXABY_32295 [Candidatus Thorarchaeota archaeon]
MPYLNDSQKSYRLGVFRDAFISEIDSIIDSLFSGRITLGMWEEDFRTRLRIYLVGCGMIGKGDTESTLTHSERGKIGAQLKKQYKWLHGFAQAIFDMKDTISKEAVMARARLYAEAGGVIATELQAGYFAPNTRRDPVHILPWLPRDGSTACLNRCGCMWILTIVDGDQDTMTVSAVWVVDPELESCEDCIPREGHEVIVEVPADTNVPEFIGLGGL